jgi:hypothetical protein
LYLGRLVAQLETKQTDNAEVVAYITGLKSTDTSALTVEGAN